METFLPTELILETFSYLYLPSLHALRLSCRAWNTFFDTHATTIYHNAAVLHRFTPSIRTSLTEAKRSCSDRYMRDVKDWTTLCRRRYQVERSWMGRDASTLSEIKTVAHMVHRIKVDEGRNFVITSYRTGGLAVTELDAKAPKTLWALEKQFAIDYAHVEYDCGFLCFTRLGQEEIWRLTSDIGSSMEPPYAPSAPPDDLQYRADDIAASRYASSGGKGHFSPWALLNLPPGCHATRFVHPYFLTASNFNAYLYDARTGDLIQTIHDIQADASGQSLGQVQYVELSEDSRYIFICGTYQLRMFDRKDLGRLVWCVNGRKAAYANWKLDLRPKPVAREWKKLGAVLVPQATALHTDEKHLAEHPRILPYARLNSFKAVHVSGRDLVMAVSDERLVYVPDYQRLKTTNAGGGANLSDIALDIDTFSRRAEIPITSSKYLAFHKGRIGFATLDGIFVLTLSSLKHDPSYENPYHLDLNGNPPRLFRELAVCRVARLRDMDTLRALSCLQMTDTRMLFTWNPTVHLQDEDRMRKRKYRRHKEQDRPERGLAQVFQQVGGLGVAGGGPNQINVALQQLQLMNQVLANGVAPGAGNPHHMYYSDSEESTEDSEDDEDLDDEEQEEYMEVVDEESEAEFFSEVGSDANGEGDWMSEDSHEGSGSRSGATGKGKDGPREGTALDASSGEGDSDDDDMQGPALIRVSAKGKSVATLKKHSPRASSSRTTNPLHDDDMPALRAIVDSEEDSDEQAHMNDLDDEGLRTQRDRSSRVSTTSTYSTNRGLHGSPLRDNPSARPCRRNGHQQIAGGWGIDIQGPGTSAATLGTPDSVRRDGLQAGASEEHGIAGPGPSTVANAMVTGGPGHPPDLLEGGDDNGDRTLTQHTPGSSRTFLAGAIFASAPFAGASTTNGDGVEQATAGDEDGSADDDEDMPEATSEVSMPELHSVSDSSDNDSNDWFREKYTVYCLDVMPPMM